MIRWFLILFLLFPQLVKAETIYLEEFEVLNGTLSIPYKKTNNLYTIYLESDATKVEVNYKVSDPEALVTIQNAEYKENEENKMTIEITKEKEKATYTFYLEKQEEAQVFKETIEKEEPKISPFLIPGLLLGEFFLILFCFYFLFIHKFKKRN